MIMLRVNIIKDSIIFYIVLVYDNACTYSFFIIDHALFLFYSYIYNKEK